MNVATQFKMAKTAGVVGVAGVAAPIIQQSQMKSKMMSNKHQYQDQGVNLNNRKPKLTVY